MASALPGGASATFAHSWCSLAPWSVCWWPSDPGFYWAAIFLMVAGLVLSAELINSALEALIDHLHPDIHPEIRIIKDMAAGAVLVFSLTALPIVLFSPGKPGWFEWGGKQINSHRLLKGRPMIWRCSQRAVTIRLGTVRLRRPGAVTVGHVYRCR